MSFELNGEIFCCSIKAKGDKCLHMIDEENYLLKEYMKNEGGIIESEKRGDIAYFSEEDEEFLLRYNTSTNKDFPNYDNKPVVFDFRYISSFKKTMKIKKYDNSLRLPKNQKSKIDINDYLNVVEVYLKEFINNKDSINQSFKYFAYKNKYKHTVLILKYVLSEEEQKDLYYDDWYEENNIWKWTNSNTGNILIIDSKD